jgi:hypothetical protein
MPQFVISGQGPGKNDILMNCYYVYQYRLQYMQFIMINKILGTEKLNRKQSNMTVKAASFY